MKRVLFNYTETIIGDETEKIIEEVFDSLLQKHKKGFEESIKGSEFIFASVDLLHYKCHKISLIHKSIVKDLQRISKIKPFINKYL